MATTTVPQQRTAKRRGWIAAGVIVIIVAIVAALYFTQSSSASTSTGPATFTVTTGSITASVSGTGAIAAEQTLDLAFASSGTVTEVLVTEGDLVTAGQPLARFDTRDLELQVASAQAALESAHLTLVQTRDGNVQPADISAQQAAVASAEAQLRSAQATLEALRNPTPDTISRAETAVRQAELALESQRSSASATKTTAEQDLLKAVDALTQAQSQYATAKGNWEFVSETGQDPTDPESTDAEGKKVKNKLSDTQRQQYYDTFVQAEAALRSAEASVQQAQIDYDATRAAEPNSIQQAEATLADAQAQLAALRNPSANAIKQARASVDQARANVAQARANLDKLTAPGTASDVAIQQVAVTQAEQSLAQAQLKLGQATLTAPFGGVVTGVTIVPGSVASEPVMSLVDRDPLHVDLKLSENDVARVAVGMPVTLTIDALRSKQLTGTVTYIATAAETSSGVVTYEVRVSVDDPGEQVKIGMTASLNIVYATKDDALLVPNSALLPNGAGYAVQVLGADGAVAEVPVVVGLSDGTNTEIVSGLSAGQAVIATPEQTSET
jgi:HlyD family secretion protein